jgi:hypothetical protein
VYVFGVGCQVGCGGVSSVVMFHDDICAFYGFSADSLQMNRSILFYFLNKMRQNCPFCSKKKKVEITVRSYFFPYPKKSSPVVFFLLPVPPFDVQVQPTVQPPKPTNPLVTFPKPAQIGDACGGARVSVAAPSHRPPAHMRSSSTSWISSIHPSRSPHAAASTPSSGFLLGIRTIGALFGYHNTGELHGFPAQPAPIPVINAFSFPVVRRWLLQDG